MMTDTELTTALQAELKTLNFVLLQAAQAKLTVELAVQTNGFCGGQMVVLKSVKREFVTSGG